jgi:phosphoglycolate phosphatase
VATERQLKLAVWDVDGTLIDSRSTIFRAAVEGAEAVGITPPTYAQVRAIVGISLFEALQQMRPDLDLPTLEAYVEAFKQVFIRLQNDPDFHDSLYPGANECLKRLKSEGWLLGTATGQSRRGVEHKLDLHGWRDLFDVTFCADDGPSKPHPHMLHCNMSALGIAAHQTVMIGDTSHDIHMARQAGVYAVGVSWGFHTTEELELAGAHVVVHSFDELNAVLDSFVPEVLT